MDHHSIAMTDEMISIAIHSWVGGKMEINGAELDARMYREQDMHGIRSRVAATFRR